MRFITRRISFASIALSAILFCSCDRHHVGEYPEVQKEQPDPAAAKSRAAAGNAAATATPATTPTPAEFFPAKKSP